MAETNKGGALGTKGPDAGPEQGGSNLGGLGATGALDRDRDIEAEGQGIHKQPHSAREQEIVRHSEDSSSPSRRPKA